MGKINNSNLNDSLKGVIEKIGEGETLNTNSKKIIPAINELNERIGDTNQLQTNSKKIVGALNEVKLYGNSVKQELVSSLLSKDSSLPITKDSSWDEVTSSIKNIKTVINGIIEQFKVYAGENISAGNFIKFINDTKTTYNYSHFGMDINLYSNSPAICKLGNIIVICMRNENDAGKGYAVPVEFNGIIAIRSPINFFDRSIDYININKIDENRALISFKDIEDNGSGKCIVLTKDSNNTLNFSSNVKFETNTLSNLKVAKINENSFLATYVDSSSLVGVAKIIEITGSTISSKSRSIFSNDRPFYIMVKKLANDKAAIVFKVVLGSDQGRVVIVNYKDSVISYSPIHVIESTSFGNYDITVLPDNKILVLYNRVVNSIAEGSILLLESVNNNLNIHDQYSFTPAINKNGVISLGGIDDNNAIAMIKQVDGDYIVMVSIHDNKILLSEFKKIASTSTYGLISDNYSEDGLVLFINRSDITPYYGRLQILMLTEINESDTFVSKALSRDEINGIAESSGTPGDLIDVKTL